MQNSVVRPTVGVGAVVVGRTPATQTNRFASRVAMVFETDRSLGGTFRFTHLTRRTESYERMGAVHHAVGQPLRAPSCCACLWPAPPTARSIPDGGTSFGTTCILRNGPRTTECMAGTKVPLLVLGAPYELRTV